MPKWDDAANEVFLQALEVESADMRRLYLDDACGPDTELRKEVESLLRAHDEAGSFLGPLSPEEEPTIDLRATTHLGAMIGRYKLLDEIGEGGFGIVYLAEQREPIRRKVALKIIKPGMDTRQVIARFEAERQALAMMDHPNIAHVFDGGATEEGRPYFVMELVHGMPITKYCDEARLTTDERLELFISVCDAVQHAHQKGVIHRDIKPSNVLVTLQGDTQVVKVIDFGVAKAMDRQLTEKTVFTGFGEMIGTPLYMSPEQMALSGLDVDTRSDIYSLGILLYELLTGMLPFDKQRMHDLSLEEFRRVIREEEPPRPSMRVTTVGEAASTLAERRKLDPVRLQQTLRGELDWIVMKALEKDRIRRYESASDFAKDIQRHLDDEPVEACPPSAAYRMKKFARRNKTALAFVASLALTLLIGAAVATGQAIRATKAKRLQREQAEIAQQERDEADKQRKAAQANYVRAREAVKQMLTRVADEELAAIPEMKEVRKQLLEDAAAFYTELLKLNSRDSQAYSERGHVYDMLMHFGKAKQDYEKAVELDPNNPQFHYDLAWLLDHCADGSYRDAHRALVHATRAVELAPQDTGYQRLMVYVNTDLRRFAEGREALRKMQELEPNSANTYFVAAEYYKRAGDPKEALVNARKAAELAPDDPFIHFLVSGLLSMQREYEKALAAINKAIEVNPKPNSTGTFYLYACRGDLHSRFGMLAAAIEDYDKSLELAPFRSNTYKRRAVAHFHLGNYDEALADVNKAIELNARDLSGLTWIPPAEAAKCPNESFRAGMIDAADRAIELTDQAPGAFAIRGWLHAAFGQTDDALADLETAFERISDVEESGELGLGSTCFRIEHCCRELGPRKEILPYLTKLIELQPEKESLPQLYDDVLWTLVDNGRPDEANAIVQDLLDKTPDTPEGRFKRAKLLTLVERHDEAIAICRELDEQTPNDSKYLVALAKVYFQHGDKPYHEGDKEKAFADMDRAIRCNRQCSEALDHRAHIYQARGDFQKALGDYDRSIASGTAYGAYTYQGMGGLYADQGKLDEAVACFSKAIELDSEAAVLRYLLASAHLAANQFRAYRTTRAGMLEKYQDSKDANNDQWTAWTYLLVPDAMENYAPVVQLAEQAVEADQKSISNQTMLGGILYRAGRFEEAVKRLTDASNLIEARDGHSQSSPAYTWYLLAMAHHRLGHDEEAKKWRGKANEWTDKVLADNKAGTAELPWNRRLTLKLFREEAEGMNGRDEK